MFAGAKLPPEVTKVENQQNHFRYSQIIQQSAECVNKFFNFFYFIPFYTVNQLPLV